MNNEDRFIERNERDASPERFPAPAKYSALDRVESHEEIARTTTVSSSGSSTTSDASQAERDAGHMSRVPTQRDTEGEIVERHPTALSRIHTQRSQHSGTVGGGLRSRTRESKKALPAFGAGKSYPPPLPEREEYVVEFDGHDDPLHAMNWPIRKKLATAAMLGFTTLTAAFGSSIFSAATGAIQQHFQVGSVVATLGTSFYVLGFATGPILWAPLSELKGRRFPLVIASFGFSVFNLAVATGKDLQTVLICRFFSGFFGACPLTVRSFALCNLVLKLTNFSVSLQSSVICSTTVRVGESSFMIVCTTTTELTNVIEWQSLSLV
jgi:DHA1 family multidrug resistance protein-like MFS transporter